MNIHIQKYVHKYLHTYYNYGSLDFVRDYPGEPVKPKPIWSKRQ